MWRFPQCKYVYAINAQMIEMGVGDDCFLPSAISRTGMLESLTMQI